MPAITVDDTLVLPRVTTPPADAATRPVTRLVNAHHAVEGAGFEVWRPFPGGRPLFGYCRPPWEPAQRSTHVRSRAATPGCPRPGDGPRSRRGAAGS